PVATTSPGDRQRLNTSKLGLHWRQLATMSPPPRLGTSRTAPGDLWRQARITEYYVAV
ncbi:hypothetical protein A2U01_0101099, partial [Trifolium medium]|nr:hypothetical protein [Trifolium medium]